MHLSQLNSYMLSCFITVKMKELRWCVCVLLVKEKQYFFKSLVDTDITSTAPSDSTQESWFLQRVRSS